MTRHRGTPAMLAYAAPNFVIGALLIPVGAMLPNIYAKHTQVTLAALGTVMVFINIVDAFTDQAVGFLSDRTHSALGARKPWMIAGTPLVMLAMAFFFIPPADAGIAHYAGWLILFGFGYTCLNIPYVAWGAELCGDYSERARLFMFHSVAGQFGGLLLFSAPLLLLWAGVLPSSEFGPDQIRYIAYGGIALLPLVVAYAVRHAPVGESVQVADRPSLRVLLRSVRNNGPFLRFISVFFLAIIGQGAYVTLLVMMAESRLGIGEQLPWIFMLSATVQILAVYPWMLVVRRLGKHRTWSLSWFVSASLLPLLALVEPGQLHWVMLILGLYAAFESVSNFVAPAMIGDCIDYDTLKSGSDNAGNYFGVFNVMIKASATLGGGLALILLGGFDYDLRTPANNGPWQHFGIAFAGLLLPAAIKLCCAALLWNFPLDERRHGIIRKRIERRAARARSVHGAA